MSMSTDEQDSDFYSDPDSTHSRSRPSDFTTDDESSSLVTLTSFDAYFLHASRPSRTSSNVFSHLVQPLSTDEFAASLSRTFYPLPFPSPTAATTTSDDDVPEALAHAQAHQARDHQEGLGRQVHHHQDARQMLARYLLELAEGFNLIFYGFGSKRRTLNDLARACAAAGTAHVLVLNAFLPSFSQRDIVAALARLPGAPQTVQAVAQFLAEPLPLPLSQPVPVPPSPPSSSSSSSSSSSISPEGKGKGKGKPTKPFGNRRQQQRRRRRLVLVIHNMDAPALLRAGVGTGAGAGASKPRALLGALAALSGVQIVGSVDHINAPLLWTSTEMSAGRWLWHDLTTLAAYDAELAGADPASLRALRAAGSGGAAAAAMDGVGVGVGGGGVGRQMTETAAKHVLAAVTQRARKLFVLMGRRQLEALADAGGNSHTTTTTTTGVAGGGGGTAVVDPTTPAEASEVAIGYDMLFNLARDHFVATNDAALRALLGEFKDHGLIVTVGMGALGSGEMLWIPLRKERLTKLLDGLERGDPP